MIQRIRRIKTFRGFREWVCPSGLPDFAKINLVYGTNGSGKSTLAALLHNAPTDNAWASGLELDVLPPDSSRSRTVNQANDALWIDIKVFGRDYVAANLRFEEDGGGAAESLLVLGEENLEAGDQRKKLEGRLREIDLRLPELQTLVNKTKKSQNDQLTKQARVVATELGDIGGRYAQRSYDAGTLRRALEAVDSDQSTDDVDVAKELAIVNEKPLPEHLLIDVGTVSLTSVVLKSRAVMKKTASSHALQALLDHPEWQSWVEQGLELHAGADHCIFCLQPLSTERQSELAAHFDESLRALQQELAYLEQQLIELQSNCSRAFAELPKPTELFQSLQKEYAAEIATLQKMKDVIDSQVHLLLDAIERKRSALFSMQELDANITDGTVSFIAVTAVLRKHNELATSLSAKRQDAAKRVEQAHIAEIQNEFHDFRHQINASEKEKKALTDEQSAARRALLDLNVDKYNPQPLADQLNEDVSHLLGHDALRFVVQSHGYRIERNGIPAEHLSEGERNAISLLYFLRSLNTHDSDASKAIIVIDDPVSSLDGNALAGASAHLWTELVGKDKCRELFLLTHNFELFRSWLSQLDRIPARRQITSEMYEMRLVVRKLRSGEVVRCPTLMAWPADPQLRNRLRSEYHYLFWRIASDLILCKTDPSPERDLEVATMLPNACRRLLEAFLGFKAPASVGNLHDQILETGGSAVSQAVRTRMLRFVHAYSHNEEADISKPAGRPEAVKILEVVFEFMRSIDAEHVKEMCKAVNIDPSDLDGVIEDSLLPESEADSTA